MRQRPYAFLGFGNRWLNMAMVSDIEDKGDKLVVYLVSEAARLAGRDQPVPADVARRVTLTEPEQMIKLRKWLKLNDEE